MTNTINTYSSPVTNSVEHGLEINDELTISSIPAVAAAGGSAVMLFNVPFDVVTMLSIALGTFFIPMALGLLDHNYAYSKTIAKVTQSDYKRLSRDKYQMLKSAVKSGHQVRLPLSKITEKPDHEGVVLVINGRNFSLEDPSIAPDMRWDGALEAVAQVYSLESKKSGI